MMSISKGMLVAAGSALALLAPFSAATAQAPEPASGDTKTTPFNYVIKDGKRVPKSNRVTNADGSWREETRVGNCVTIKEGSAAGEVKITRRCD